MKRIFIIILTVAIALPAAAQADKKDVRSGNRLFRKGDFKRSEIDYRKGLVKDSTSFAANYDLASSLYHQEDYAGAGAALDRIKESAPMSGHAGKYWFNKGDVALRQQDWGSAVDAFKQALIQNPDDMDAKESYVYAKKKLEDQQNQQNQNQDQDQQDQDQQNQDQNQNQDQDQDQNQNQDKQDQENQQQPQPQQGQMSPQQAQALLKAVQAADKKTQDKVNKEKAAQAGSRRNEKNW